VLGLGLGINRAKTLGGIVTDGLTHWFKCKETGDQDVTDSVGGVVFNDYYSPSFKSSCYTGNYFLFPTEGEPHTSVETTTAFVNSSANLTIELWVAGTDDDDSQVVTFFKGVSSDRAFDVRRDANERFYFKLSQTGETTLWAQTAPQTVGDNEWVHIWLVYNVTESTYSTYYMLAGDTTPTIVRNAVATNDLTFTPPTGPQTYTLGGSYDQADSAMGSLKVYNKLLTEEEMIHNHLIEKNTFSSSPY
jgi:hypothetical protein